MIKILIYANNYKREYCSKLLTYRSEFMEIIDLKKYSNNKLVPISKYGNTLVLSEKMQVTIFL